MRALIAIARMIMVSVFHMLSKKEVFNADLYDGYYEERTNPYRKKAINQVLSYLAKEGYFAVNTSTGEFYSSDSA